MRLMVATGLDGTLITHKGVLTKYTEETLLNFRNHYDKNYLVIASSRGFQSVREYLKTLKLFKEEDYTICFNGCEIVHNKTGKIVYSRYIKGKDIKRGLLLANELGLSFFAYNKKEEILYNELTRFVEEEAKLTGNRLKKVNFRHLRDNDEFVKMSFAGLAEPLNALTGAIRRVFKKTHNAIRCNQRRLDVYNKEASKGTALCYLKDILKIDKSQILAFGDHENDYSLLKEALYRFVMKNCHHERVTNFATEIIPSNREDGVAKIVNKYVLPEANLELCIDGIRKGVIINLDSSTSLKKN